MDVFLVPLGRDHHELYCEVPDEAEVPEPESAPGYFRRLVRRFREMLAEAERERRAPHAARAATGWAGRLKGRTMRWVAESIAEQRLLWHLRRQTNACLFYPDDMEEAQAGAILRAQLQRDFEKHRFWMVVHFLAFVASGALMLIPGPNLLAYYFAFRLVGHYLSLRGARRGLSRVQWSSEPSEPLSQLRRAIDLDPEVRGRHVQDVAVRLRLEHLARFFERAAVTNP